MNKIVRKEEPNDILRPLNFEELQYLMSLYKNHIDKTSYHYTWILNHYKLSEKVNEILTAEAVHTKENAKLAIDWNVFEKRYYTHRYGDLKTNGTFVSITKDCFWSISFNTLQESLVELRECLEQTKLIDWQSKTLLAGVHMNIAAFVEDIAVRRVAVLEKSRDCFCYIMKRDAALNLKIPEIDDEFRIGALTPTHAEKVHSMWPNNLEGSLDFVKGLILVHKTLGVFRKVDNNLVAWIFQYEFSGIGILQVLPEVQRKGFGYLLVASMSKLIAELGDEDIIAFTVQNNIKSKQLLQKVGFQITDSTKWIEYKRIVKQ